MTDTNGTQSFNLNTAHFPPGKSIQGFWEFVRNNGLGVSGVTQNRVYGWGGLGRGDGTQLDPRRDIHKECGHPENSDLIPEYYQKLYDRNPVAARVVEVMARESWQVTPEIYETEDEEQTPFEIAFDQVGKNLRGMKSHYRSEKSNPIWGYLRRLDEQSGIGSFGVLLFGFSDVRKGDKHLHDPCDPVMAAYQQNIQEMAASSDDAGVIGGLPEDELIGDVPDGGDTEEQGTTEDRTTDESRKPSKSTKSHSQSDTFSQETQTGQGYDQRSQEGLKLLYLRVFPQSLVFVTKWDGDKTSPRYGHPIEYMIQLNDPTLVQRAAGLDIGTVYVHWTRILHVADNLTSSEIFGVPRMKTVLNELLNVDKVLASSPEMMYRGALPGISFETHPQLGGDVRINPAQLKDMYEQYINSMDRVIVTSGLHANSLAPTVVDPTPHFTVQIDAICIKIPIPKRIFIGSERGELASTQDDDKWNDTVKGRENGHVTENIVVPFINRLIDATVLPTPEDGFYCTWPDITSASAQQKATYAMTIIQGLSAFFSGDLANHVNPQAVLTNVFPFTDEQAKALIEGGASDLMDEFGSDFSDVVDTDEDNPTDGGMDNGSSDQTDTQTPPQQNINAFCKTGEGGGVDPHCAAKSGKVGKTVDATAKTTSTPTYHPDSKVSEEHHTGDSDKASKLRKEFASQQSNKYKEWSESQKEIDNALTVSGDDITKKVLKVDGKIVGAMSLQETDRHLEIRDTGSTVKGGGSKLVDWAKKEAKRKGKDLFIQRINPGSEGFWEKQGLKKGANKV